MPFSHLFAHPLHSHPPLCVLSILFLRSTRCLFHMQFTKGTLFTLTQSIAKGCPSSDVQTAMSFKLRAQGTCCSSHLHFASAARSLQFEQLPWTSCSWKNESSSVHNVQGQHLQLLHWVMLSESLEIRK